MTRIFHLMTGMIKLFLLTSISIFLFPFNVEAQLKSANPNVIFILCDQMRADAVGATGNTNARTPNIDALASQGAMFLNNFSNNPVCLPSRISMFSGLYPSKTGVLCNKHQGEWLGFENSLPWYFQQAGYRLGYIGKNHTFRQSDLDHFDVLSLRGREEFRAYSKYVPPHWHSDVLWPEEDCNPGKNTQEAIAFINQSTSDVPFFLTVSYFDPHPPYMAPAEYTSRYCSEEMILPEYIDPAQLGDRLSQHQKALHYDRITEADLKETLRYYYASVEWGVDHQIGVLLKALEQKGISENTILVFTSDHGDFMGEHHMVRKGIFHCDALLHVPMIWFAPGRIEKGLKLDYLTQNADIFPTLLDLAGIELPEHLDGQSLRRLLQGQVPDNDDRVVYASAAYSDLPQGYCENPEPYFNPESSIPFHTRVENLTWKPEHRTVMARTRNWKLILSETHRPELYHMKGGFVERQNLYGQARYQEVFIDLEQKVKENWEW